MSGKVTILPKQTPIVRVLKKHTPYIDVRHEQKICVSASDEDIEQLFNT